jgi:hypothetical protein
VKSEKATLYVRDDNVLLNNGIFNAVAFGARMKSDGFPFIVLKKALKQYDIDLSTQDINAPEVSKYIFCLDYPEHFENFEKRKGQYLYLIISEPAIYTPGSWDPKYHKNFDKIFTYNPRFGFNEKYRKYTFPIDLEFYESLNMKFIDNFEAKKLCSLVANAVQAMPPPEKESLLHERYKVIEWFGKNHPDEFDFYSSVCKDRDYYIMMRGIVFIKKIMPTKLYDKFVDWRQKNVKKVYRGFFDPLQKVQQISNYRFYLCYENVKDLDGYVTEKIFECFYARCIPIYWGAGNIAELVPANCFVDARQFGSVKKMYEFMKNMTHEEYKGYIRNIEQFLNSEKLKLFSVAAYAEIVMKEVNIKQLA